MDTSINLLEASDSVLQPLHGPLLRSSTSVAEIDIITWKIDLFPDYTSPTATAQ
jgi:hypothetical protein